MRARCVAVLSIRAAAQPPHILSSAGYLPRKFNGFEVALPLRCMKMLLGHISELPNDSANILARSSLGIQFINFLIAEQITRYRIHLYCTRTSTLHVQLYFKIYMFMAGTRIISTYIYDLHNSRYERELEYTDSIIMDFGWNGIYNGFCGGMFIPKYYIVERFCTSLP